MTKSIASLLAHGAQVDRALAEREDQPLGLISARGVGQGESASKLREMKEEMDVSLCSVFICVD